MNREHRLKFFNQNNFEQISQINEFLSSSEKFAIKVVSQIFPFRTNNYVVDELINWKNIPEDPMYQLTFMQKGMLPSHLYERMANAMQTAESQEDIANVAREIREQMNPHPGHQKLANVPHLNGKPVPGLQHKYRETALVFPSKGQTCFAYCTFCFRWAQFIGEVDLKFSTDKELTFLDYLKEHKEVTDVLFTGGDPMVMNLRGLEKFILPLLQPEFDHIKNIRIGSKVLAYWPYRFVTDPDSEQLLNLFEKVITSGKNLAFMAHYNHWVELETEIHDEAVQRLKKIGVTIRTQSPILKHINNSANAWAKMWMKQVEAGMFPYYMFVERDTGPNYYFEMPLAEITKIFREAYNQISGLARTVKGPVMSTTAGKIAVNGITEIKGERVFALSFVQGRNPDWVGVPFFAKYDEDAKWINDLKPAFGEDKFFFEEELEEILNDKWRAMQDDQFIDYVA
ncbi:MAG: lysine 2,3-aminomutase [Chlorobi bacterium]|nr:lysine 2,3-aminomutase [Chlorobiota bacterium]